LAVAEHLHLGGLDFRGVALLAVLVLPGARAVAAGAAKVPANKAPGFEDMDDDIPF
jgi:hypothetical protein